MFPNLNAEMARNKMSLKDLSQKTGIKYESLKLKMRGKTEFKYSEIKLIRAVFPEYTIDYLFSDGSSNMKDIA